MSFHAASNASKFVSESSSIVALLYVATLSSVKCFSLSKDKEALAVLDNLGCEKGKRHAKVYGGQYIYNNL